MVDAGVVGLLVGLATFLVLGGYYELRSQPNVPLIVRASFLMGLTVQLVDSIVINGTWGLVTISTPDWVRLSTTTMGARFSCFPDTSSGGGCRGRRTRSTPTRNGDSIDPDGIGSVSLRW
ncbi:hypothetical protein [Halococcus salsus]|uniref:hypothetical protein n=1 Tax=Halococcus salsus TaxID=2162894 RepID=UPI001F033D91|nr:hypothetical protein [Halococcus salsus]